MAVRGPKPGTENAKKGGQSVLQKYGPDYYRRIGALGAEAAKKNGRDFHALGRIGGAATAAKYGQEYYKQIGRRGGLKSTRKPVKAAA